MNATITETVQQRVIRVIATELGIKEYEVEPEFSFADDLDADEVMVVEIAIALAVEFDLDIPDERIQNLRRVQDAIDFVAAQMK